jgi:hypothetical protein
LAYQPPASSTFLSEQTSHQPPASSTFLSQQISTSHQPPAKRTGRGLVVVSASEIFSLFGWLVANGWCWFALGEEYCWLVAGLFREKSAAGRWLTLQAKRRAFDLTKRQGKRVRVARSHAGMHARPRWNRVSGSPS